MIGFLDNKIFEFKDIQDLSETLSRYGSDHMCDLLIIVDNSHSIVGVLENERWNIMATLSENKLYYLYGVHNRSEIGELEKGENLPNLSNWVLGPEKLIYESVRYPRVINF
jgi:hypothetical protein